MCLRVYFSITLRIAPNFIGVWRLENQKRKRKKMYVCVCMHMCEKVDA